jgi:hypothetical protein
VLTMKNSMCKMGRGGKFPFVFRGGWEVRIGEC